MRIVQENNHPRTKKINWFLVNIVDKKLLTFSKFWANFLPNDSYTYVIKFRKNLVFDLLRFGCLISKLQKNYRKKYLENLEIDQFK